MDSCCGSSSDSQYVLRTKCLVIVVSAAIFRSLSKDDQEGSPLYRVTKKTRFFTPSEMALTSLKMWLMYSSVLINGCDREKLETRRCEGLAHQCFYLSFCCSEDFSDNSSVSFVSSSLARRRREILAFYIPLLISHY